MYFGYAPAAPLGDVTGSSFGLDSPGSGPAPGPTVVDLRPADCLLEARALGVSVVAVVNLGVGDGSLAGVPLGVLAETPVPADNPFYFSIPPRPRYFVVRRPGDA